MIVNVSRFQKGSDNELDEEYLWENIDDMQEVRINPTVVFILILLYCFFGAVIMSRSEPSWTFADSFYFSFISCMKIGFGDIVPTTGVWVALFYR